MGDLTKYLGGKFIKLGNGESFIGIYKGYELKEFKGKPTVEYKFDVDGKEKVLTTSSFDFGSDMESVACEEKIRVTRHGLQMETKYAIERSAKPAPEAKSAEETDDVPF